MTAKVKRNSTSTKNRPTIGLLITGLSGGFQPLLWAGIVDIAQERDVNLICFSDIRYSSPAMHDTFYNLVDKEGKLDGLIVMGIDSPEFVQTFCEHIQPLPVVSIEYALPGIPSVLIDDYCGMYDLVSHLIEVHGRRQLAFILGPEDRMEVKERYRAYTDALAKHNIPLDPKLVVHGNYLRPSGAAAGQLLLDERKVKFDAVVAANDTMALGVLDVFLERRLRIPQDITIVGFDDLKESEYSKPPLSTVHQPIYERGQQGIEILLALLAGEQIPERVVLPTQMVIRRSCGCLDPVVIQAAAKPIQTNQKMSLDTVVITQREKIVAEMAQAVEAPFTRTHSDWAAQWLEGITAEIKGKTPGLFLQAVDEVLGQVEEAGGDVGAWQNTLSVLRRHLLPHLNNQENVIADDLWQQARVMISQAAKRAEMYQAMQTKQRAAALHDLGAMMINTFDMERLMDVLVAGLLRLDIRSCYLSLYEEPKANSTWSRLILAYNEQGLITLDPNERRFRSSQLTPPKLWAQNRRYSYVVEPLYFQEEQLGFVMFEIGPREENVYEVLREQINSALKGALLVEQEEKRTRQLQAVVEVSRGTSTILDTGELLQCVVDLTQTSFNFYHVQIYLLDKAGDNLHLAAGAGKAGRQIATENQNIPLGQKQSLVVQAAWLRRSVIANDTQADSNSLHGSLLPETRSEIATPLIIGERVLGVLDVQSNEVNHFTDEDIYIQTTLAAHVATTLQNTHSFTEQQRANQTIKKRVKELNCLNEIGREIAERPPIPEFLQWVTGRIPPAMQYPKMCVAAIKYEDQVYGVLEAVDLPSQIVHALRIGGEVIGRVYIAYTQKREFLNEESALIGGIANRLSGYIESRRLFEQTQAALDKVEQSQQFLRTLLDNIPTPIFYKDRNGAYLGFNRAYLEVYGQTEEEMIGKTVYDLNVDKKLADLYHETDMTLFRNPGLQVYEASIKYADGIIHDVIFNKATFTNPDGSLGGLVGTMIDITDRKRAEEALRQSEMRYRTMAQNLPVGIYRNTPGPEGRFLAANEALAQMFGYSLEEFLHIRAVDLYENPKQRKALSDKLLAEGKVISEKLAFKRKDGSKMWGALTASAIYDETGKVQYFDGVVEDITERKQIEEILAREQNLLRTLIDAIPNGIYVKDTAGRHLIANKNILQGAGLAKMEDVIGKTDLDIYPLDLAQVSYASDMAIIQSGQPRINYEETWRDAMGCKMWLLTTKLPLYDNQGQVMGLVGLSQDITKLKQIEEDLARERNLLRTLIDVIPSGVYVKDTAGRHLLVNQYVMRGTGVTKMEDLLGKTDLDIYPPELAQVSYVDDLTIMQSGQSRVNYEEIWQDATGQVTCLLTTKIPLYDRQGQVTGLVGMTQDITERKQIEEALRENEAQLSEALTIARLGNWQFNVANQMFTFTDQFYSLLHTTAKQEGGYQMSMMQYIQKFMHPDDTNRVDLEIIKAIETNDSSRSYQLEHHVMRVDGDEGYMLVRFRLIQDERRRPVKIIGASQDITEQKQAEFEREHLLTEIEATYRRYIQREWEQFLDEHYRGDWYIEYNQNAEATTSDQPTIIAPIALRGQVVGTLSLQDVDPNRHWTTEEKALLETVSEQLALTLENLRLFEDTQKRATREQLTRRIVDKMRAAPDINSIVHIGLAELAKTLNIPRAYVKFVVKPENEE